MNQLMVTNLMVEVGNREKWVWLLLILVTGVVTAVAVLFNLLTFTTIGLTGLVVSLLILALFAYRPGSLLILYLLTLPAYTLTLAFLYHVTGSPLLINLLQPWKEVAALFVLSLVLLKALAMYRIPRLHLLDILTLFFLGLNLLYLILPWGPSVSIRLYGFRANTFWVIIYWLGRLVPLSRSQQKWVLGLLVAIGALTGLMTIVEVIALPLDWPIHIGLMDYLRDFSFFFPRGNYGLTWTFETATGLRRRSAFWANPLELASSTLITGMATLFVLFRYRAHTWGRFWTTIALGLVVLSLLLSVSRASLIAFVIQVLVASFWLRKPRLMLFYLFVLSIGVVLLLLVANQQVTAFIW
ncbi:MAG: hypothetical protein KC413_21655, partial [Anaerolineales bacterium]|nr:hypothetical protein [Anaerolineales bacterium]